jgi:alkanesulfonate monooxygenase SsuD/methylene tetrahydromethanopterin reductase-like flavin-dependent oxidoreductase (luciferase family)
MNQRTGVLAFWKNYDRKLYLRAAELADELGYDSFWLPEGWGYEIFSLLAEMAGRTKRIKLGTAIVNVFSRSPGLIAMSAATVDEISEGRFVLGLGTSGARVIEGFHGRTFEKPLTQLHDVIKITRTLLAGGKITEAGAQLGEYRPFALEMGARPSVPIYVAALKKKSITAIGELADGWIPTFWPFERIADARAWIDEGAAKAGRDPSEISVAPFTTVIPLGNEMGERKAREIIAFYIAGMGDYYKELLSGFGYTDECSAVEALYRDKSTRSRAYEAVSPAMMRALMIAGDPSACLADLQRIRELGVDLPILALPNDATWPMVEQYLKAMAPRS